MRIILKALVILAIIGVAAQQFVLYYQMVIADSFLYREPINSIIITGVIWPVAVAVIAAGLIWLVAKFDPKTISFR